MYSFDVFDTLITWRTATIDGIFAIMREALINNPYYHDIDIYIRSNFHTLRQSSQDLAWLYHNKNGCEEITLYEIYQAMAMTGVLSENQIKTLMTLEKDIWCANTLPINEKINQLRMLISSGEHVVLISDMYLDKHTLKSVLLSHDPIFLNIPIYVSSEYRKSKRSGNLYKVVQDKENVAFNNWVHYGDNPVSDISCARCLGINAHQNRSSSLIECEEWLLRGKNSNTMYQTYIGVAKNVRLFNGYDNYEALGASVGGELIIPYIQWVLNQAVQKGIKRLYFIARDGYILKKVADILISQLNMRIDTKYVYSSRKAWRIASIDYDFCDIKEFIRIGLPESFTNISKLAEYLQISEDELLHYLPPEYNNNKFDRTNFYDIYKASCILNQSKEFKEFLIIKHKEKRELTIEYLKQEIDTTDDSFAFIELCGTGFTQLCASKLMSSFYSDKITTFYFKSHTVVSDSQCIIYNYLPCNISSSILMELIYTAPHGSLSKYIFNNGTVKPSFSTSDMDSEATDTFMSFVKGISEYALCIAKSGNSTVPCEFVFELTKYLANFVDNKLYDYLGRFKYKFNGSEKSSECAIPTLTNNDIKFLSMINNDAPANYYYPSAYLGFSWLKMTEKQKKFASKCQIQREHWQGKLARRLSKRYMIYAKGFSLRFIRQRVAIFGAGILGKEIYKKIRRESSIKIVKWVDSNWETLKAANKTLESPEVLKSSNFEQVIIAIYDESVAMSVKTYLQSIGITEDKIIWQNPDINYYNWP